MVDEDEIFDGGELDSATEVESIRLESFVPSGSFVSELTGLRLRYVMTGGWKLRSDSSSESL